MAISIPRAGRKSAGKAAKAYTVLQLVERAVTPTVKRVGGRTIVLVGGAGAAVGGMAVYLLGSRRRRKEMGQRGAAAARHAKDEAVRKADYAAGQARGAAHEAREKVKPDAPKPDITGQDLAHKVETILFRDEKVPKGDINIDAAGGTVVLRGEVPSAEMRDELVQQADAIPEVARVDNLLHLPGEPAPNWPSPEDAAA
jgi:hypothetical protein